VRGEVRISANPTSILGSLPRDLQAFASRYPLVRISLDERRSAQIVRAVAEGDVDIGLFYADTPHPQLQVLPYATTRLVLVAPVGHPLARRARLRFAEAADYPFVLHPESTRLGAIVQGAAQKAGFSPRGRFQILTQEGMRRLVEAGMGIAVMPEPSVLPYARLHRLRCIRIDEDWARLQTSIGIRRAAAPPMVVRALFSHLTGAGRGAAAKRKS
jgi:DNA-binding transcriptional LysR family regulator